MVKFINPFLILPAKTPLWGFPLFQKGVNCPISTRKDFARNLYFRWLKGGGGLLSRMQDLRPDPEAWEMSLGILLKAEIISCGWDHNRFCSLEILKRLGYCCFNFNIHDQHNSLERDLLSRMQGLRPDPRAWEKLGQQQILYKQINFKSMQNY